MWLSERKNPCRMKVVESEASAGESWIRVAAMVEQLVTEHEQLTGEGLFVPTFREIRERLVMRFGHDLALQPSSWGIPHALRSGPADVLAINLEEPQKPS